MLPPQVTRRPAPPFVRFGNDAAILLLLLLKSC
jgi:hypothetical protein